MTTRRLIDPKNTVRIQAKPPLCVMLCLAVIILPFLAFVVSESTEYALAFGLSSSQIPHQPWRLLTSLLWFGPPSRVELMQVLGAVAGIWVFGPPLERWWGPWRLALLILVGGVLGNLTSALVASFWQQGFVTGGPGAAAMGPAVAATTLFFHSWFILPTRGSARQVMGLSGRHVAIFLAAVMVLSFLVDLFSGRNPARYAGYVVSAGFALLLITEGWRPWVIVRRRRIRKLAKDSKVVLFEDHLHQTDRHDPRRWN